MANQSHLSSAIAVYYAPKACDAIYAFYAFYAFYALHVKQITLHMAQPTGGICGQPAPFLL